MMMTLRFSNVLKFQHVTRKPVHLFVRSWHREPIQVSWKKPDIGWTKLNFDGSCKCKTGKSSIGGIFRDHNADFILGYAESIGKSNSTIAEFAALERGLQLIIENGWTDVWLEGDSKTLVEIIGRKKSAKCEKVQKHVSSINLMISGLDNCKVTHIFREGNRSADKFAKIGHKLKKPEIWLNSPPKEVLQFCRDDADGKVFLRRR